MPRALTWFALVALLATSGCLTTEGQTAAVPSAPVTPAEKPAPEQPRVAVPPVNTDDLPKKACLTAADRHNDLLVRLQTELSVTGLTCQWKANGTNLLDEYARFSRRHLKRILDTQVVHGRFLAKHSKGSGARLFDSYRTTLANEEMMIAGRVGHPAYCADRYARFQSVMKVDEKGLDAFLKEEAKRRAKDYKDC